MASFHKSRTHHVCVDCRVSFKNTYICPHCQKPMVDFGKDFKAPKKTQDNQWKKLKLWTLAHWSWFRNVGSYSETKMKYQKVQVHYSEEEQIKDVFKRKFW